MLSHIEGLFRRLRRIFSRSEWAIRLLRLSKLERPTAEPGLVMVQIDGLSFTQFNRALQKKKLPFLGMLLRKEQYVLHPFYSGLPSNTPAVQGELFYGVKGCVPAFNFMDRSTGEQVKMFDAKYVEKFEPRLKAQGVGLLEGGSSYSNIYTGGAKESHFCWGKMGWDGIWHAINPTVLPFVIILYLDIFVRTFLLLVVEFFLAVVECLKGTFKGRVFLRELELVYLRTLICVFLRDFIVAGVCMDIRRGLPVIHMNFLGYDEQAHCRGPSSRFAHWALLGIDEAIKNIHHVMRESSYRDYDLWVYSDHGQEKTVPYLIAHGRTIEDAVKSLFGADGGAVVTAMGPLGHIYWSGQHSQEARDSYALKLVHELKIPLVITKSDGDRYTAWTPRGSFALPEAMDQVFGIDHPFLEEMRKDLMSICRHPDAGEFIIGGWSKGEPLISFPLEYGAHAAMGSEETRGFTLMPVDAPIDTGERIYMRPLDLREAALRFLNKETPSTFFPSTAHRSKSLRLMSYNVHGCLGMDGGVSTERIARVIARYSPDIIALQELDVGRARSGGMDQAERIARKLEMHYHFHPTFRWKDEQYGNAILSRYPVALMKMGALPRLADKIKYEPRGAVWVSVEFQGMKVQIFNTHLSLWPQERLLQAKALLSDQWVSHPECSGPVVLCGDFNAIPGSTTYRNICHKLKDSQAALPGHTPHRTWFGRYPIGQLDHIFLDQAFTVNSITVPRTALDKMASDHLPLIADLDIMEELEDESIRPVGQMPRK